MQKIVIVGAGTMGRTHAEAYAAIPDAKLVAVCDSRPESAQALAALYRAEPCESLVEALDRFEVDAVDICTPTASHLECIKTAAAAGKHVCCEKPLARNIAHAGEAIRVCREAGVTLFVAHVLRWFPEFRKLRDLVVSGAIGEPVVARTTRAAPFPRGTGDWFADVKQSGGVVLDMVIHDFDWLRWLFGDVSRVYARGLYASGLPLTDYALITLRFQSGVVAHVEASWALPSGFLAAAEVAGTDGLLSFSSDRSAPLVIQRRAVEGEPPGVAVPESPTSKSPYCAELEHFISCLETGKPPDVTPEDALEAVRIGEAALRSIATGEPVKLA